MRTICRTICTTAAVGIATLMVAACQASGPNVATCYGVAGSRDIDQCAVVRTTTVQQYRTSAAASESQVATEVRDVCTSYGLQPGSQLYANCLVREADRRHPTNYAGNFARAGERYDQNGHLVDAEGFLIDKTGRRIGGRGYWVRGPGDTVPPGTYVGPGYVGPTTAQAIMAPPPRPVGTVPARTIYAPESYPYSNTTAFWQ
jgi:hypothetical protein